MGYIEKNKNNIIFVQRSMSISRFIQSSKVQSVPAEVKYEKPKALLDILHWKSENLTIISEI